MNKKLFTLFAMMLITLTLVACGNNSGPKRDHLVFSVWGSSAEVANYEKIAKAYEESLWHFGQEIELLDSVELWSQEEAVPFEKNHKTGNEAFLGAVLSGMLVVFVLLFYYVLEDACYVERDAAIRFGLPVYGLLTKENDEMQRTMMQNHLDYVFGKQ